MINIAICDDEPGEIQYLNTLVRTWAAAQAVEVCLTNYESAESFLFAYAEDKQVDVLLLDIQMGGMDGVSLARKIRKENKEMQILFITGYMDYIADGYEVEALHYLLKPVTEDRLFAILNRATEKLAHNARVLFISHAGESVRIPLYEIRYLAVWQNYVTIYAAEEYTLKKTLSQLEKQLDDSFFRTGRSHIVNLRYVRKTTKAAVFLADGAEVPLSRGMYEGINRAMIQRL